MRCKYQPVSPAKCGLLRGLKESSHGRVDHGLEHRPGVPRDSRRDRPRTQAVHRDQSTARGREFAAELGRECEQRELAVGVMRDGAVHPELDRLPELLEQEAVGGAIGL